MTMHDEGEATLAESRIRKESAKAKVTQSRAAVLVEFPDEGETLIGTSYAFRISATPAAKAVELAIDRGDWRPCREAVGYWWYDWSGYKDGEHEAAARTHVGAAISVNSAVRKFTVQRRRA